MFVFSPGGMTDGNNSAAFRAALAHSSADYVYDRVTLTRTTLLPAKFSWIARVTGQVANGNLQSSEQLTDGGPGSVRGYYTDAAIGSEGVLVSQEILTPAVSLAKLLNQRLPVEDQAQFGAFWDYGHVSQVDAVPDQVNSAALSSVGVDVHLTLDRYVDVRFDTGWQPRAAPGANDRQRLQRHRDHGRVLTAEPAVRQALHEGVDRVVGRRSDGQRPACRRSPWRRPTIPAASGRPRPAARASRRSATSAPLAGRRSARRAGLPCAGGLAGEWRRFGRWPWSELEIDEGGDARRTQRLDQGDGQARDAALAPGGQAAEYLDDVGQPGTRCELDRQP